MMGSLKVECGLKSSRNCIDNMKFGFQGLQKAMNCSVYLSSRNMSADCFGTSRLSCLVSSVHRKLPSKFPA